MMDQADALGTLCGVCFALGGLEGFGAYGALSDDPRLSLDAWI